MKKCPKCEKIYDDSWDVCLSCNALFIEAEELVLKIRKEEIDVFKEKVKSLEELTRLSWLSVIMLSVLVLVSIYIMGNVSWFAGATLMAVATLLYTYTCKLWFPKMSFMSVFLCLMINDVLPEGSSLKDYFWRYNILPEAKKILKIISDPLCEVKFAETTKEELEVKNKFAKDFVEPFSGYFEAKYCCYCSEKMGDSLEHLRKCKKMLLEDREELEKIGRLINFMGKVKARILSEEVAKLISTSGLWRALGKIINIAENEKRQQTSN